MEIEFRNQKVKPTKKINLNKIEEVVFDKDWLEKNENTPIYYLYSDLAKEEDRKVFPREVIRYDIILIPAKRLGNEFVKTKPFYYSKSNSLSYPAIYQVLRGSADFFLQKRLNGKIQKGAVVRAEKGDHVFVPPHFAHKIINTKRKPLKISRLVSKEAKEIYGPILNKKGCIFFELVKGFKKNENYKEETNPHVHKVTSRNDFFEGQDLYDLIKNPKQLEILNKPEEKYFMRLNYYK